MARHSLVLALGLTLGLAAHAAAQTAPNRAGQVAAVTQQHPEMFGDDDTRRAGLVTIACALNVQDQGNWGRLTKLDQGGKIPADILVWRPTREHFDILTDSGPAWMEVGVLTDPNWQWSPVTCAPPPPPAPVPVPVPVPSPSQGADYRPLLEQLLANQAQLLTAATQELQINQDTNAHVKSMDKTLTETLGNLSKFLGKYVAPAIGAYLLAKNTGS